MRRRSQTENLCPSKKDSAAVGSGRWPLLGLLLVSCVAAPKGAEASPPSPDQTRVIVFVWDGLRPDSVSMDDTPNLIRLRDEGVLFDDQHATYPTLTMMNAASLASGSYPETNGFYGNTVWMVGPKDAGRKGTGVPVDLSQPIFTEDYGVLDAMDQVYSGHLLLSETLFEAAQDAGISTAVVGKVGAAYLQDRHRGGWILEERLAWPSKLVDALASAHVPSPYFTPLAYGGAVDPSSPNPTAEAPVVRLADGVTGDPSRASLSPANADDAYLMNALTEVVLPVFRPRLLLVWLRNPDTTEHAYGPGTSASKDALRGQDALLGQLRAALDRLGLASTTDFLVVSDHGHSTVSGPQQLFPLRALADGGVTGLDPSGYSVSGEVRTADLLNRAAVGLHAVDGLGCVFSPVLSGITANGKPVYPGLQCPSGRGTTVAPGLPGVFAATDVVVVPNGGSDYLYLPSHDRSAVARLVRFLQSREEYGPIFIARRFGELPGTFPLDVVRAESPAAGRTPDVVVSFSFTEDEQVEGVPGTEFSGLFGHRGMHGTTSPRDVHNTLVAAGPHFRHGFHDTLPSGNVDIAPTVASLFGLKLPRVDGRVLEEALVGGLPLSRFVEETHRQTSSSAEGLRMALPTNPDGQTIDGSLSRYRIELETKTLQWNGQRATYLDWARAVRE